MAMQGQGFPWQQMMQQQMPRMQQQQGGLIRQPPQAVQQQMPQGALERMQQAMQQRLPPQMQQQQMAPNTGPQMPFPSPPQVPMQGFNPFLGAYGSNFRQNVQDMQLPMPGFGYQGFYNIPGVTPPAPGMTGREPPPEVVQSRRPVGGGGGGGSPGDPGGQGQQGRPIWQRR